MIVRGLDGTQLGVVERFEIDGTGQLTGVVTRCDQLAARKRIAAALIRDMRLGALTVALSTTELHGLPNVVSPGNPFVMDGEQRHINA